MKLKELREWGFFILAVATLIIGIMTIVLYLRTNPSIEPDIDIDLLDQTIFNIETFLRISHMADGNFWEHKGTLNFKITNLGLKDTGYLNFYISDPEGEYDFDFVHKEELESLSHDFFYIEVWNKKCKEIVHEVKRNNGTWRIAMNECKNVEEDLSLSTGIRRFLLKVDCPGCQFNKGKTQCYSFNVCIYKSGQTLCEDFPNYYNLKERSCPEDWQY